MEELKTTISTTYAVVPPIEGQTLPTDLNEAIGFAEVKSRMIGKPVQVFQLQIIVDATKDVIEYNRPNT